MVNDFLTSLDGYHQAIQTASAQPECQGLFEAAHALKGSAENLGAYGLAAQCAALERAAAQGQLPPEALQTWVQELHNTREALQSHLSER